MPNWGEVVGTIGPVAAVLLGMWFLDRKTKSDAPKEDPAAKLAAEIAALNTSITSLRSELAELGGFIKGRMK